MSLTDVQHIAEKCSHFAMCKTDFLETGLCHSAIKKPFVAYFPQGRMEITNALNKNMIPVTQALVDIAQTCDLCGICDKQCYFINELHAFEVAQKLKQYVEEYLKEGKEIAQYKEDDILKQLKEVVGDDWASSDPAILVSYSRDGGPFSERKTPKYVVMVQSIDELVQVVKIANNKNISIHARASGSSGVGLALGKGMVIDFYRMKKVEISPEKLQVTVQPGVTGYELQKEVIKHGYKINVGEASAGVCSNIITTRLNSLFSHQYGNGLDLVIDGKFVDPSGEIYTLSGDPYNLKEFNPHGLENPPLCAEMTLRIFPKFADEEAIMIPFHHFSECLNMLHELTLKQVGIGLGVISSESASIFISPTHQTEKELNVVLKDKLGINYMILLIGETHAINTVKSMTELTIDQDMFRNIIYSIPKLYEHEGIDMLVDIPSNKHPFEVLFKRGMEGLVEVALNPEAETYYQAVDQNMQAFYRDLLEKDQITSISWLNLFRLTTPRLSRKTQYSPILLHCGIDEVHIIPQLTAELDEIGKKHGLESCFSNLSPLNQGRWVLFEYDFFHDQSDEIDRDKARKAINESYDIVLDYLSAEKINLGFLSLITRWQGLSRFDSIINKI